MRKKDLEEKNNNTKMDDVYPEAPSVEVRNPVPATPALRHTDPVECVMHSKMRGASQESNVSHQRGTEKDSATYPAVQNDIPSPVILQ